MAAPKTNPLAQELCLPCGQVLPNRLAKSALSEQLGNPAHQPDLRLQQLYRSWARGGCGLLVSGNIMVDREHLGEPGNVVLDTVSDLAPFRNWTQAGRENGTRFWAQLNHPGKQSPILVNRKPVAPSAVAMKSAMGSAFAQPEALSQSGILRIVDQFARSAERAREAGFDGVQIHAAHGYLVSQFFSPLHNQRRDQWGGSVENRARFARRIYAAIRRAVGDDFAVGIKLNSADFQRGGFSQEDSLEVSAQLAADGMDLIEVSGGTYEAAAMVGAMHKASTREREAYFADYAQALRKDCPAPILLTGGFRTQAGMQAALADGTADVIGLGRPLCLYPNWPHALLNQAQAPDCELPRLTTGIPALDKAGLLNVTWYQLQLQRLGRDRLPQPQLSPWRSLLETTRSLGLGAFMVARS